MEKRKKKNRKKKKKTDRGQHLKLYLMNNKKISIPIKISKNNIYA